MDPIIECIVAGGPQHGLVYQRPLDPHDPGRMAVVALDGGVCLPAARTHAEPGIQRMVLLHPQATGRDLLRVLAH